MRNVSRWVWGRSHVKRRNCLKLRNIQGGSVIPWTLDAEQQKDPLCGYWDTLCSVGLGAKQDVYLACMNGSAYVLVPMTCNN